MNSYHQTYDCFPAAAVWSTQRMHSLALHKSRRIDLYTQSNWAQALLPFADQSMLASKFNPDLPVAAPENEPARNTPVPHMTCSSDVFNTTENSYLFQPNDRESIAFARGNYAINGGSHCFNDGPGSTAFLTGDNAHLEISRETGDFRFWGNGVAGFNVCFSYDDFENGTANLVALEEVRAGVHPIDPRGVWSLGQIGGSVTWGHGVNGDAYGPNNQHPKSDDLLYGDRLNQIVGADFLRETHMPCVSYVDLNFQATSRSSHPGGVNLLTADGACRFVSDAINPGLWHVMHSRETPNNVISGDLEATITNSFQIPEKTPAAREIANPDHDSCLDIENSTGMRFVLVPEGEFEMGVADQGNSHELPEESPQHHVRIANSFYIGIHEVTQRQYSQIMENPQPASSEVVLTFEADNLPIVQVTWHDADEFCKKLSALPAEQAAGRRFRLPTEAEWEYACRGGDSKPYAWFSVRQLDDVSGDAAGINPPLPVRPVGSYAPNTFGLYDMRGNVWEWCDDWFDREYYLRSPSQDPRGPQFGYIKVVRGSSWTFIGEGCKLSYPMMPPWKSSPYVGFRVVCEMCAPKSR